MSREIEQREIDGAVYEFQQFRTTVSLTVLSKLSKLLGEPIMVALGAVLKGGKGKAGLKNLLEMDLDPDALAKAVRVLIDGMDDVKVVALVQQLATEGILCDHKPLKASDFDFHFAGRLSHLVNVVKAQLEVQYGNFFGAISASPIPAAGTAVGIRQVE